MLWKEEFGEIEADVIAEIVELTGKRIYLFVDRASIHVESIGYLLLLAKRNGLPVTVVAGERTNEWNVYCGALDAYVTREIPVGRLSRGEIERLIDLLGTYNSLGHLAEMSREARVRFFHEHADRQLLVALHEATRGKPFEEIILEEYQAIVPDRTQQLYLDICTLNHFYVTVRAGSISRISGIIFSDYDAEFLRPLETLVFALQDAISGDYHYRARHAHVAEILFRQACPSDIERADQFIRLVRGLDIGYSSDLTALSKLVRGRTVAENFVHAESGRDVYRAALEAAPNAAFLHQQWAIFESNHDGGSLEEAQAQAEVARRLEPQNNTIIHTQAEIARKRALAAKAEILKEQFRRQARERLNEMRNSNDRFAMSTRCKLLVDEIEELAGTLAENVRIQDDLYFSDKVRTAEQALERATQQYPDDPEFLQVEARFRGALEQTKRALEALERAWAAGPRGSGVAIRLARVYSSRGERAKALGFLESALDRSPQDKAVHLEFARELLTGSNDDVERAGHNLARSYAKGDNNHEARHLHAQYLFMTRRIAEAATLFAQIDQSAPQNFRTRANRQPTLVSARLPTFSGRVAKKTSSYAFVRTTAYVKDVFVPSSLTSDEDWEKFELNDEIEFQVCFNRAGPVAMRAHLSGGLAARSDEPSASTP